MKKVKSYRFGYDQSGDVILFIEWIDGIETTYMMSREVAESLSVDLRGWLQQWRGCAMEQWAGVQRKSFYQKALLWLLGE